MLDRNTYKVKKYAIHYDETQHENFIPFFKLQNNT